MDHYTDYNSYSAAFAGFMKIIRDAGLKAGLQCSKEALDTALQGLWLERDYFEYALASICCNSEEEKDIFKQYFSHFWREKGSRIKDKTSYRNKKTVSKRAKNIAVMTGIGSSDKSDDPLDAKTSSGANAKEVIKKTDFSKLTASQTIFLDELAEKLLREMSLRMKRRRKSSPTGIIDIGSSIRKNIQKGGNIIELSKKARKKEKFRLLILLDVSGSMDKYSYYLLKFIWTLRNNFKQIEAFAFSTRITRMTDYLSVNDLEATLTLIAHHVTSWSSGTQIGKCLEEFNTSFSKKYLNGKTVTIILSDGLDTGEPEILEAEIQKIKLKSKKLIWLNPLKGMTGYKPIQKGMKAALPSVNHFGSAHNLESLLELENLLSDA